MEEKIMVLKVLANVTKEKVKFGSHLLFLITNFIHFG
jgi:hypothetical protein